jgi:hypothetical protein
VLQSIVGGSVGVSAVGSGRAVKSTRYGPDGSATPPSAGGFVVYVLYDAPQAGLLTFDVTVTAPNATVTDPATPGIVQALQVEAGGVGSNSVRGRSFHLGVGPEDGTHRLFSVHFDGNTTGLQRTVHSVTGEDKVSIDGDRVRLRVRRIDGDAGPMAVATATRTVVTAGGSFALDATDSTAPDDGDSTLEYAWTQTGDQATVIEDADAARTSVTLPRANEFLSLVFEVTVTDSEGRRDADTVTVSVLPDDVVALRFDPGVVSLAPGQSRALDVVVEGARGSVEAVDFGVTVSNPTAVQVTSATVTGRRSEGSHARISQDAVDITSDDLDIGYDGSASVTVASLMINGISNGDASLTFDPAATDAIVPETVTDEAYTIGSVSQASVSVGPPTVRFDGTPTDPDADGRYEDVNGDDEITILDVREFLGTYDEDGDNPRAGRFDFDGNGRVTILDARALLDEV